MWLVLTFIVTIVFACVNYFINEGDYFHPSVIFCVVFCSASMFCLAERENYQIEFHFGTFGTITASLICFTLVSIFFKMCYPKNSFSTKPRQLQKIAIPNFYIYILLIIQVLTIYFFIKHLLLFSVMYDGKHRSLMQSIDLYDKIFKFHNQVYNKINAPVSIIFRIGDPISRAGGFLMLYIAVNNFFATKKINFLEIMPVIGVCGIIFLRGSRSPLFRVFTMAVLLIYVFAYRYRVIKKGNISVLIKVISAVILLAIGMLLILPLMGRKSALENGGALRYLFIYMGAPLLNLDRFIANSELKFFGCLDVGKAFGNFTFMGGYAMLKEWFGFSDYDPNLVIQFTKSESGLSTGNVYTHFYKLLYDFGFGGTVIINLIPIIYYCWVYQKRIQKPSKKKLDFSLFLYSYLFNDLVMSVFSTRFFETTLSKSFLKVIVFAYLLDFFLIERKIKFLNGVFSIKKRTLFEDIEDYAHPKTKFLSFRR